MEYLFVLSDKGGWWLKIDSVKKLEDYHKKTDEARYEQLLIESFMVKTHMNCWKRPLI